VFVGRIITSADVDGLRDEFDREAPIDWVLFFAPTREACIARLIEVFKAELARDVERGAGVDLVYDIFKVAEPENGGTGFIEAEYTWTQEGEQVSDELQAWFTVVEAKLD
jgi:hypothetical protein